MYLPFFIVDNSVAIMSPIAPSIPKAHLKLICMLHFSQNLKNQPNDPKITPAAIPARL
jgi:hypothetical protein